MRRTPSLPECPHRVMVKSLDRGIVVSEFELQSRYYVHFRTNINYPLSYGLNSITSGLKKGLALNNSRRLICH